MPIERSSPLLPGGNDPASIRDRVPKLKKMLEQGYLMFARDVWSIYHRKLYIQWGYETYDDYIETEVGVSKDSAYRARLLFETFTMKCGVRPEELDGIGRARATMIRPLVTKTNARDWIEAAKELSWSEFNDKVQKAKRKKKKTPQPATSPESPTVKPGSPITLAKDTPRDQEKTVEVEEDEFVLRRFHLPPETDTLLDEALAEAQRITQSHSAGFNLGCILQHFLAHRLTQEGKTDGRLYYHLRHMEKIYGGRLIHIKDDKAWELLSETIENPKNANHFGTTIKEINVEPSTSDEGKEPRQGGAGDGEPAGDQDE